MADSRLRSAVGRRRFFGACTGAAADLAALPPAIAQEAPATAYDLARPLAPPPGAFCFDFGPDGRALLPPLPHGGGTGAVLRNSGGQIVVIVEVARLLHADKIGGRDAMRRDLDALDLEAHFTFSWDPSNGRGLAQRAGHAVYEVGLLEADGCAQYRLQSRTASWPVAMLSGLVFRPYEDVAACFGRLRLPLPTRGYVAATIIGDVDPDSPQPTPG